MRNEKEIIEYYIKRLYDKDLTTMSGGNLSVRGEAAFYVTPSEIDKGNLKADDIMEVRKDGEVLGKHRVTSEFAVHRAVYEANPGQNAVLHSHTSSILGYSTARILPKVRLLAETGRDLDGKIGMAAYADPGTKKLAEETVKVLDGSRKVAILENHGLFIADRDMAACYDVLEDLDLLCAIECNARRMGAACRELGGDSIREFAAFDPYIERGGEAEPGLYPEERRLVTELLQRLYRRKISTCKNACFSCRLENGDVLVNPEGVDVMELTPEALVVVRGRRYLGDKRPHRDAYLHLSLYDDSAKNNAVITARPPYTMAYACSDKEYETKIIAECYGYLRNIVKKDFCYGEAACEALRGHFDDYHNTVLIRNYLSMVAAEYPLKAYDRMEVAESTAMAVIGTAAVGEPVPMSREAVEVIQRNCGIYPEGGGGL